MQAGHALEATQTSQQSAQSSPPQGDDNRQGQNSSQPNSTSSNEQNKQDTTSSQEPPAKPDGDTSSAGSDTPSSNEQPPEKPNSESSNSSNDESNAPSEPPSMSESNNQQVSIQSSLTDIAPIYYVAFCIEGILLGIVLSLLFATKFNKITLAQLFKNRSNIAIVVLSALLSCSLSVFGGGIAVEQIYAKESPSQQNQNGAPQAGQSQSVSYSASKELSDGETLQGENISSSNSDENTILASGDISASMDGITIEKTGDSDGGDSTSFYGNNSGILAKDGANLEIKNATITTDATGANGVFSYGGSATTGNSSSDGTTVNISNSKITTSKDNSGGIMTTGGGIMNASNLSILTSGTSSAAIRTDRGGGVVKVDGGDYTTTGKGSPAVYSTADISVKNATLEAKSSEGICIEGKNSVSLDNVTLNDNNTELNGLSTTYKNIFLYQSMSGDADSGTSKFTSKNSKITTNNGDTLYVTNTNAEFNLENNEFINNDKDGNFLRVKADSWGKSGSNGGDVVLNLTNQKVSGNIVVDSISTLVVNMTSGSSYEGAINSDNSAKSIAIKLSSDSKIKLTGDTYVTSLDNEDLNNSNIDFNGYKLYVNGSAVN